MIRAVGLVKRFGTLLAVDHLSFEVEAGETFAIVGPNGAGKTTTLKMLLGLVRPDAGEVRVGAGALPAHDPRARETLGYVPQRVEFPARTVREVLGFFAALRALPAEAVPRALDRVGLAPLADRRADLLSGGYTQRLSLAQALLSDPEVLVLDEPTASLDPEATWEFRTLLEQLRRDGKTIVLCSHLLAEVERVADRVLILVDGRTAALERLDDLRARQISATQLVVEPEDLERAMAALRRKGLAFERRDGARLAIPGGESASLAALEALRDASASLRGFEVQRPTLEEAFLAVVRGGRDAG